MKKLLALTMAAIMFISCAGVEPFGQYNDQEFAIVVQDVELVSSVASTFLAPRLKPDTIITLKATAVRLKTALEAESISMPTSLTQLIDLLAKDLTDAGVDAKEMGAIKVGLLLLDQTVGRIDLGSTGIGDARTKQVMLAILRGLQIGLM